MSVETEARLTIGWRVDTKSIPDYELREWKTNWNELDPFVDRARETFGEELYREDLCDDENEIYSDTYIIGISTAKHELSIDAFLRDMDARAVFAREVYQQVMRELPKDGPYMISWKKVW